MGWLMVYFFDRLINLMFYFFDGLIDSLFFWQID